MLEALLERYHFELYSIHGANSRNSLFVHSCSILISRYPCILKGLEACLPLKICNGKIYAFD